jgi:hypothetical protein
MVKRVESHCARARSSILIGWAALRLLRWGCFLTDCPSSELAMASPLSGSRRSCRYRTLLPDHGGCPTASLPGTIEVRPAAFIRVAMKAADRISIGYGEENAGFSNTTLIGSLLSKSRSRPLGASLCHCVTRMLASTPPPMSNIRCLGTGRSR